MLAYLARRAVFAIFTLWAVSVLSFIIIQLPPRGLCRRLHGSIGCHGDRCLGAADGGHAPPVCPGQAHSRTVPEMDWKYGPRQLRRIHAVEAVGPRCDRRQACDDHGRLTGGGPAYLGHCRAHRNLFGSASVFDRRLCFHLCRFHRSGGTQFPSCPGADVPGLLPFRGECRRSVFRRNSNWNRGVGPK